MTSHGRMPGVSRKVSASSENVPQLIVEIAIHWRSEPHATPAKPPGRPRKSDSGRNVVTIVRVPKPTARRTPIPLTRFQAAAKTKLTDAVPPAVGMVVIFRRLRFRKL